MFTLSEHEAGNIEESNVQVLLHSVNEPMIAAADRAAEPTRAYVCTVAEGKKLQTYIVLNLVQSGERVVYVSDEGPFDAGRRGAVEEEALDFVENMGFMMDNANLHKLKGEARKARLSQFPIFASSSASAPAAPEASEELSDLLSAFETPEVTGPSEVPPPTGGHFVQPHRSAKSEFDEKRSMEMLEQEFQRDQGDLEQALDSAIEAIVPEGSTPDLVTSTKGKAPLKQEPPREDLAFLRFMASF